MCHLQIPDTQALIGGVFLRCHGVSGEFPTGMWCFIVVLFVSSGNCGVFHNF
jgi:hypothetical protein